MNSTNTTESALRPRLAWVRAVGIFGALFGLLTIKEGGAVLFVDGAGRAAAGNFVPFVLWFNFLAGFVYVVAGIGLWFRAPLSGARSQHSAGADFDVRRRNSQWAVLGRPLPRINGDSLNKDRTLVDRL